MTSQDLKDLLALEKKFYTKLTEAMNLTQDLSEAVGRQDEVSVKMLISMRQRPILELQEVDNRVDLLRLGLSPDDAVQFDALLAGDTPVSGGAETVSAQIATNRRLLMRLTELDQSINKKLRGGMGGFSSAK